VNVLCKGLDALVTYACAWCVMQCIILEDLQSGKLQTIGNSGLALTGL
jgi:hypothetical protein